jgi:hypothetical protein
MAVLTTGESLYLQRELMDICNLPNAEIEEADGDRVPNDWRRMVDQAKCPFVGKALSRAFDQGGVLRPLEAPTRPRPAGAMTEETGFRRVPVSGTLPWWPGRQRQAMHRRLTGAE